MALRLHRKQPLRPSSCRVIVLSLLVSDPETRVVRETNVQALRVYWKSLAEMFIPSSLWESTKNAEQLIFEAISPEDIHAMMHQSALV